MRDIAEIKADIEFVRKDLNELRKMGASTGVAMEDLYELLKELEAAREGAKSL